MIIAVDFDGTIVPDIFFPDRMPDRFMPGAKEALTELHRRGHALVLWTLRDHDRWKISRTLQIAVDFLNANGLGFMILPRHIGGYEPNTPKFPADIYIDDKIPGGFQGWDSIMRALVDNGVSKIATATQCNGALNPSLDSRNVRANDLDHGVIEPMRGSGRAIDKPICGPLITSGNHDRNQPDIFSCIFPPLNCTQMYVCPAYYHRPFQQQVNCPLPTIPDARCGFHQGDPLLGKGACCGIPQTGNDDATNGDAIVHANSDRHDGEDD